MSISNPLHPQEIIYRTVTLSCRGTPILMPPSRTHQLMPIFNPGPDRPVARRHVILHLFQSLPSSPTSRRHTFHIDSRPPYRHKEPRCSMYSRHVHHSMPPQRRLLTRSSRPTEGPITRAFTRNQRTADPLPLLNVPTTPVAIREVSTEPSTPTSPTLDTHGYRRALWRQRRVASVQAVLHYDQSEKDLQPWFW